jgi:hypothetical protein
MPPPPHDRVVQLLQVQGPFFVTPYNSQLTPTCFRTRREATSCQLVETIPSFYGYKVPSLCSRNSTATPYLKSLCILTAKLSKINFRTVLSTLNFAFNFCSISPRPFKMLNISCMSLLHAYHLVLSFHHLACYCSITSDYGVCRISAYYKIDSSNVQVMNRKSVILGAILALVRAHVSAIWK